MEHAKGDGAKASYCCVARVAKQTCARHTRYAKRGRLLANCHHQCIVLDVELRPASVTKRHCARAVCDLWTVRLPQSKLRGRAPSYTCLGPDQVYKRACAW